MCLISDPPRSHCIIDNCQITTSWSLSSSIINNCSVMVTSCSLSRYGWYILISSRWYIQCSVSSNTCHCTLFLFLIECYLRFLICFTVNLCISIFWYSSLIPQKTLFYKLTLLAIPYDASGVRIFWIASEVNCVRSKLCRDLQNIFVLRWDRKISLQQSVWPSIAYISFKLV